MKHDWEYKKLGEVCEFVNGFAFKSSLFTSTGCPILRISNIQNDSISDEGIVFFNPSDYAEDFEKYKVFNGDIVIAMSGATTGKIGIHNGNDVYYLNQRVGKFITKSPLNINTKFLFYTLKTISNKILNDAMGVAQPNISSTQIKNYSIPTPSLSLQEQIVSELDKLSLVIEKKKQQVKELDNLAQAIFYDMFGDPVENEKGWEVKKIEEICSSIVRGPFGSALKKEFFVKPDETTYKVYEQKHAIQKNASIGDYYISEERFRTLKRFEVRSGDIIMSCSGTIGEFFEIPIDAEKGLMNQALLKFTLNQRIDKSYFLFTMEFVKNSFEKKGSGLQNIGSVGTVKSTLISLPPLSLQQSFAQKIESIERQKELINQSIREAQTLFDSRMEYYFGE